jgi:hypothetical protein
MLSELFKGISTFFTKDKITVFVILIVIGLVLSFYSSNKFYVLDNLEGAQSTNDVYTPLTAVSPSDNEAKVEHNSNNIGNPSELLPKDVNSQWTSLNSVNTQNNVLMPDLLQAGYHIGLDTIGQTLRNANQQLRSDPIIPKIDVGPFLRSTIEPDLGRVPLELGSYSR